MLSRCDTLDLVLRTRLSWCDTCTAKLIWFLLDSYEKIVNLISMIDGTVTAEVDVLQIVLIVSESFIRVGESILNLLVTYDDLVSLDRAYALFTRQAQWARLRSPVF